MGIYAEYIDKKMSYADINSERQHQLQRIKAIRNRDILVFASDMSKQCPNGIQYGDLLPFYDKLASVKTKNIDIILETPGGDAVIVEDMVKRIRAQFGKFAVIIPGSAKSAGTIFAMAADEILMAKESSLGPIDAQIMRGGKVFSAGAFLEGIENIKRRTKEAGKLDPVYLPILYNVSPGEIQHCENAQMFSQKLVADWLRNYKFRSWNKHKNGDMVTDCEKEQRAKDIAEKLANTGRWLTHGRSIHIEDLEEMGLKIHNIDDEIGLKDAVGRYYALLKLTFQSPIYKLFETIGGHIEMRINEKKEAPVNTRLADSVIVEFICPKCHHKQILQGNFKPRLPLTMGAELFPSSNMVKCASCGTMTNLASLRQRIEKDSGRAMVF